MSNNKQPFEHQAPHSSANISGGVSVNSEGGTSVGRDVVGRDKIEQTTIIYGPPEDRSCLNAIVGIAVVAAVLILGGLVVVWVAGGGKAPQRQSAPTPTPTKVIMHVPNPDFTLLTPELTQISPEQFVHGYYQLIGSSDPLSRDYLTAWNELTPHFREERTQEGRKDPQLGPNFQFTYDYYVGFWQGYYEVEVRDVQPSQGPNAYRFRVVLRYYNSPNKMLYNDLTLFMELVPDYFSWQINHTEPSS